MKKNIQTQNKPHNIINTTTNSKKGTKKSKKQRKKSSSKLFKTVTKVAIAGILAALAYAIGFL